MFKKRGKRILAAIVTFLILCTQLFAHLSMADELAQVPRQTKIVLTLGADLTEDQRAYILQFFGITEGQVETITITNADERSQLGKLIPEEVIGTRTFSCALVRPTASGGIQVKTANMNYVTSNTIASNLSTSGVYNCEVLTAAPFEVSGTGALTGVMMAYETASGEILEVEKKELANEELVITGEIAGNVGQDQATLVVNDIKIHIVRDQISDQQQINAVVDEVVSTTERAAYEAAAAQGIAAPTPLTQENRQKLYEFGYKFSQQGYRYKDLQPTLERVTHNVTVSTGIKDPITDTFTTITEDNGLSADSILLGTDDNVLGEGANINATNSVAIGDHPAEPIDVFTGDVVLTEAGGVSADGFIRYTNIVSYKDLNGSYALMDLNGNMLTDPAFTRDFDSRYGNIIASLDVADSVNRKGVFASDGTILVPFEYGGIRVLGKMWIGASKLTEADDSDYDFETYSSDYYKVETVDLYFVGGDEPKAVASLSREENAQIVDAYAFNDYLSVQYADGQITLYDSTFTPVQQLESLYSFSGNDDYAVAEALSDSTGYYVSSFEGAYARIRDWNQENHNSGIIDRYGNLIVPMQFDNFDYTYDNEGNMDFYEAGGYFSAQLDGRFVFVTAGGDITGNFSYPYEDVRTFGMAARYEADNGDIILLAGDGAESNLGSEYSYVTDVSGSRGMLWECSTQNHKYDLVDWHGNVLVAGCEGISLSANGNYVIAQTGYTSNTLYLVNDASPVSITESAGGAVEVEASVVEVASMEAYSKDPVVELAGETLGTQFVRGTDLIRVYDREREGNALFDVNGTQLTDPLYYSFEYQNGWIIVETRTNDDVLYGVVSERGTEVIPCEYDYLEVLTDHWAVAYKLVPSETEDEYDFTDFFSDDHYVIDTAAVFYLTETEVTSATLTRDQIKSVDAKEGYVNIRNRTTGAVTTYDSTFTAVASVNDTYDFDGVSQQSVLKRKLKDQTGYSIVGDDFVDGYAKFVDYSGDGYPDGIMDAQGNIVVPPEYDYFYTISTDGKNHLWDRGYFSVRKDGKCGFVTEGGVVTCPIEYPVDDFSSQGIAARVKDSDGTYFLVSADGIESVRGSEGIRNTANGLFWEVDGSKLVDWHGNIVFEDYYRIDVSSDGKYIILQKEYGTKPELYVVDGAEMNPSSISAGDNREEAPVEEETSEVPIEQETQPESEEEALMEQEPQSESEEAPTEQETQLLSTALTLVSAGLDANSESVLVLLQQAQSGLNSANPDAAQVINSAITLLNAGAGDENTVSTLITTAAALIE